MKMEQPLKYKSIEQSYTQFVTEFVSICDIYFSKCYNKIDNLKSQKWTQFLEKSVYIGNNWEMSYQQIDESSTIYGVSVLNEIILTHGPLSKPNNLKKLLIPHLYNYKIDHNDFIRQLIAAALEVFSACECQIMLSTIDKSHEKAITELAFQMFNKVLHYFKVKSDEKLTCQSVIQAILDTDIFKGSVNTNLEVKSLGKLTLKNIRNQIMEIQPIRLFTLVDRYDDSNKLIDNLNQATKECFEIEEQHLDFGFRRLFEHELKTGTHNFPSDYSDIEKCNNYKYMCVKDDPLRFLEKKMMENLHKYDHEHISNNVKIYVPYIVEKVDHFIKTFEECLIDSFEDILVAVKNNKRIMKRLFDATIVHSDNDFFQTTAEFYKNSEDESEFSEFLFRQGDIPKSVLNCAAYFGHFHLVEYICKKFEITSTIDCQHRSAIYWACDGGYLDMIKYFSTNPKFINEVDKADYRGVTPLHRAVANGYLEIVQYLIEAHNVDYKKADHELLTVLHYIAADSRIFSCEGIDFYWKEKKNIKFARQTLMIERNKLAVVKYLLEKLELSIADALYLPDCMMWTPIHLASDHGHLDVIKYLAEKAVNYGLPFDANVKTKNRVTPLFKAAEHGHLDIVLYLIERSDTHIEFDQITAAGKTLAQAAALSGNVGIFDSLVNKSNGLIDFKVTDNQGWNPLHVAVGIESINMINYLMTKTDVDVNGRNFQEHTPLHLASDMGAAQVIQELIQNATYTDILLTNIDSVTSIHLCARNGHLESLKCLMNALVDCNRPVISDADNPFDLTPLHLAASEGHPEVVKYLLRTAKERDEHIDLFSRSCTDSTILHSAAFDGHYDVVKFLLTVLDQEGIDLVTYMNDGWPILDWVAQKGCARIMELLVDKAEESGHKIDLFTLSPSGCMPIHAASEHGNVNVVRYIIETSVHNQDKIDLNIKDEFGTPIHAAALFGYLNVVEYLVEASEKYKLEFDLNAQDKYEKTAWYRAHSRGHSEVADYLEKKVNNTNSTTCRVSDRVEG